MIPIVICVILSGIITLFLIAPIMQSRPRTCYLLIVCIPMLSLGASLATFPLENTQSPHTHPKTPSQRAEMHIKQGEFDEAIRLLTQIPKENRETTENSAISQQLGRAYFAKGLLHAEHNEQIEALNNLNKALEVSPDDAEFLPDLRHFINRVENMGQENDTAK